MIDNNYQYLRADYDNLQFGSLEPLMGQASGFLQSPQEKFGNDAVLEVIKLAPLSFMIEVSDYFIYPNPVAGNTLKINTNDPKQVESFMIINGAGQVIIAEQLSVVNNHVDISSLTKGIYIVKIAFKNNTQKIEKLVVK